MSEDSGFIRNKLQKKEEREYAPDFCGSLGKGMLATEALRNAQGLNPLSFGVHERIRNRMSAGDGFSATEGTETMRNSARLTPLHNVKEPQGLGIDERRCEMNILSSSGELATEKTRRNLSGLSVPLSLRGEFHKIGVI